MSIGNFNLETLPEYEQVCEYINPVYANIIFSYLAEIRKKDEFLKKLETPIFNIGSEYGKKHGIEKRYYLSGEIEREIPYINNKKHGIQKWYYQSGRIEWETLYNHGELHGIHKEYYKSGEIKKILLYENGKLI
jgi:antitoxin component YwqK of YwqJK toxin-antitoxin module